MSYSFSVTGNTREEAKAKVAEEFAKVVEGQPMHANDQDAVVAASSAFIDILLNPSDDRCISISVWGSLSWADGAVVAGSVNVSALLVAKPQQQQ